MESGIRVVKWWWERAEHMSWEDGENQSGYRNADEHEEEALFSEQVMNRACDGGPWLSRFG